MNNTTNRSILNIRISMAAAHLAAQWVTGVNATEQRSPHHTTTGLLAATSESWHCLRCFFFNFITTPRIKRVPGYFVSQRLAICYYEPASSSASILSTRLAIIFWYVLNMYCIMKHHFSSKYFFTFSKYASINNVRILTQSLEDAETAQKSSVVMSCEEERACGGCRLTKGTSKLTDLLSYLLTCLVHAKLLKQCVLR